MSTKFYDVRGPIEAWTIMGEAMTRVTEYTRESPFSVTSRTVGYFALREEAEEWVEMHTPSTEQSAGAQ